jgi:hypothetical protein
VPGSGGCGCCPRGWGVYFLLALGLFPRNGYLGVWARLTAALDGLGLAVPSPRALRDLRRRLGAAPLQALFEVLAGPAAWPRTPGVRFGRYRTVSFDGCRTIKVPDTARNRGWLGKMNAANGETGRRRSSDSVFLFEGVRRGMCGAGWESDWRE